MNSMLDEIDDSLTEAFASSTYVVLRDQTSLLQVMYVTLIKFKTRLFSHNSHYGYPQLYISLSQIV